MPSKSGGGGTLGQAAAWCLEQVDTLPLVVNGHVKEIATAVAKDLIENTPVDVGTAMSNWIVSLDEPVTDIREAYDPSPKGRVRQGVWTHKVDPVVTFFGNVGSAEGEVEAIIETRQPGQDIYISSNIPYIRKLNDGSSDQVPAGFVERAYELARVLWESIRTL